MRGAAPALACRYLSDVEENGRLVKVAPPPLPPPRTNRTCRVLRPVLIGHAASLTPAARHGPAAGPNRQRALLCTRLPRPAGP